MSSREQIVSIFNCCDKDGRGWITPEQLAEVFQLSEQDVAQLCEQLDPEHTGKITFNAFMSFALLSSERTDTTENIPIEQPIEEKLQTKKRKIAALKQQLNLQKTQLHNIQMNNIELTDEISKMREALYHEKQQSRAAEALKKQLETLKIENEAQRQKIEDFQETDAKLRSSKASAIEERNILKDTIVELEQQRDNLQNSLSEKERTLKNTLRRAQERDELLSEIERLRESNDQLQERVNAAKILEKQLQALQARNSELETLHKQDEQLINNFKKLDNVNSDNMNGFGNDITILEFDGDSLFDQMQDSGEDPSNWTGDFETIESVDMSIEQEMKMEESPPTVAPSPPSFSVTEEEWTQLQEEVQSLKNKLDRVNLEKENLSKLRSEEKEEFESLQSRYTQQEELLTYAKTDIRSLQRNTETLTSTIERLEEEKQFSASVLSRTKNEMELVKNSHTELLEDYEKLKRQLTEKEEDILNLTQTHTRESSLQTQKLEELQTRYNNVHANCTHYFHAAQNLDRQLKALLAAQRQQQQQQQQPAKPVQPVQVPNVKPAPVAKEPVPEPAKPTAPVAVNAPAAMSIMDKIRAQYRQREKGGSIYPMMRLPAERDHSNSPPVSKDFINERLEQTLAPATRYVFSLYNKPNTQKYNRAS